MGASTQGNTHLFSKLNLIFFQRIFKLLYFFTKSPSTTLSKKQEAQSHYDIFRQCDA